MKFQTALVAVLTLVLGICCFGQDVTFNKIIGRNPNSPELRVRLKVAKRNHTTFAKNIKPGIGNDWAVGFGATSAGNAMLFLQYPGTWVTPNGAPACTDYEVAPANGTPVVGGQANVLILANLYRGGTAANPGLCGVGTATVQAAYAVGTTPLGGSSPTFSFEGATKGTTFAILERANAKVHIVTVGTGGTAAAAKAPTETVIDYTNAAVTHCAAGTVHTAMHSNVWVDYSTDEGYVGDDAGRLYHISGIFNGARVVDFCTTINGPAYIAFPEHLYVGGIDYVMFISNGRRLYVTQVNTARTGFTNSQDVMLSSIVGGITDDIIIDSDDNRGYVWTNHDATGANAALYQIQLLDSVGDPPTISAELNLGPVETTSTGTTNGLYVIGDFDHTFYMSGAGAANATGYTEVYPTGITGAPALASFQFDSTGVITGFTTMTANTTINPASGTITGNQVTNILEAYDSTAAADMLFVGTGNGTATNANKVSNFDITTPLTANGTGPTVGVTNISGGTSAMVLDWEDSGLGNQTQNIYFGNLATPNPTKCGGTSPNFDSCIIKLQDAGLN